MNDLYRRWFDVGLATWTLGVEASAVVALRSTKILMGGDMTGRETRLMVSEKLAAAAELQTAFLIGRLGNDPAAAAQKVVKSYSRKVRANRRRLS